MNGRKIPDLKYDRSYLQKVINKVGDIGLFCTMLGTNDLLMLMEPDAGYAVQKMEAYLDYLCCSLRRDQILIIAPPYIGNKETADSLYQRYYQESIRMNAGFRDLSKKHNVRFADSSLWDIEMSFDLVHFSERGHRSFAEKMTGLLTEILGLQR
jgi:lysophospholipase L1-like esterase